MGAATATILITLPAGHRKLVLAEVAPSTSYAAGGETVEASIFNLTVIDRVLFVPSSDSGGVYAVWDNANAKVLVMNPTGGGGTQPTTPTDPSVAAGAGASTTVVPGRAKEMGAGGNLSTLKFPAWVIGY